MKGQLLRMESDPGGLTCVQARPVLKSILRPLPVYSMLVSKRITAISCLYNEPMYNDAISCQYNRPIFSVVEQCISCTTNITSARELFRIARQLYLNRHSIVGTSQRREV
eukprot:scaffold111721_cov47-Prasinocladus_malaysianus.AAC.3